MWHGTIASSLSTLAVAQHASLTTHRMDYSMYLIIHVMMHRCSATKQHRTHDPLHERIDSEGGSHFVPPFGTRMSTTHARSSLYRCSPQQRAEPILGQDQAQVVHMSQIETSDQGTSDRNLCWFPTVQLQQNTRSRRCKNPVLTSAKSWEVIEQPLVVSPISSDHEQADLLHDFTRKLAQRSQLVQDLAV
eukprot:5757600-Amphidinium_carterae.3